MWHDKKGRKHEASSNIQKTPASKKSAEKHCPVLWYFIHVPKESQKFKSDQKQLLIEFQKNKTVVQRELFRLRVLLSIDKY